jgi:hypothetical protein
MQETKKDKKYIKHLIRIFMASCNPRERYFYGSQMLDNGGKLIIKETRN